MIWYYLVITSKCRWLFSKPYGGGRRWRWSCHSGRYVDQLCRWCHQFHAIYYPSKGYAYYHQSGLKTAVQTSKEVKAYLQSTKDSVVEKTRQAAKNPSQALETLKAITKSYVAFIPGSSTYVDSTFEQIEELQEKHGDETNKVLQEITDEISKTVSEGKPDISTAAKVIDSLRKGMSKLQELGKKIGGDALEKNPKAKEMLSTGFGQLMSMAGKGDQEAKKAYEAISERVRERRKLV